MPQIRGAFPLPIPAVAEGMNRISLASGSMFYFPQGNYLVSTDPSSIVQVLDPVELTWRLWITASTQDQVNSDGYNYRALNLTGAVTAAPVITGAGATLGTGGIGTAINGVAATVSGTQTAAVAAQTATLQTIVGGAVAAPTITQAGTGYLVPPLIAIDPPPLGGIQATATAVLASIGGGIASITMQTAGAGYVATPNFWVLPQPNLYQGSGAFGVAAGAIPPPGLVHPNNAAPGNQNTSVTTGTLLTPVALVGAGTLTGLVIVNPGSYYITGAPTIAFTSAQGGTLPTATLVLPAVPAIANFRSQPRYL
jgi:hypothetical protein